MENKVISKYYLTRKIRLQAVEEKNRVWLGQPAIFPKFDWISIVFNGVSLSRVFNFVGFDFEDYEFARIIANRLVTRAADKKGYDIVLSFNGVHFYVDAFALTESAAYEFSSLDEFFDSMVYQCDFSPLLEAKVKFLKLEFTGSKPIERI